MTTTPQALGPDETAWALPYLALGGSIRAVLSDDSVSVKP